MRTIRQILVAIKDPTAKSLPAVTKAAQIARAGGAGLELFHSLSDPLYVDIFGSAQKNLKQIEQEGRLRSLEQLERVAAPLRKQGIEVTVSAQWDFPAYEAIVRRANRIRADFIVAERHAGRHIAPGLLQLTDWELLRLSPVPVLLVKAAGPYKRPVVMAAIDPTAFDKPRKLDDEILQVSVEIKKSLRGTLHALHAYAPLPDGYADKEHRDAPAAKRFARLTQSAEIPRARTHMVPAHPALAIPETAKKLHSSIVVMGDVARTGLQRLLFGNTAERLLDRLNCDVLIVKPPRFTNRVRRTTRGARLMPAQPIAG
jgi:universal stress protein E